LLLSIKILIYFIHEESVKAKSRCTKERGAATSLEGEVGRRGRRNKRRKTMNLGIWS
jgi:hypothetical protein